MRIATFNLCEERKDNFSLPSFLRKVEGIEVLCLQEFYLSSSILEEVMKVYPFYHFQECSPLPENERKCYSNVILSKRKLYFSSLGVFFLIGGKRIYLFNIHFNDSPYQPYQLLKKDYGDGVYLTGKDEYSLFEYSKIARGKAVDDTLSSIKKIKGKVILCGDFNEPEGYYCSSTLIGGGGKIIIPPKNTFHDGEYSDKIDLFYLFGFGKKRNFEKGVIESLEESDHSLFWIEINGRPS